MKIIFDHQIFTHQKFGGISRYIVNLSNHINKGNKIESKIFAPFHTNIHLRKFDNSKRLYIPTKYNFFKKKMSFINQKLFEIYIKNNKPDIHHATYYDYNFKNENIPKVLTVYDLIHEKFSNNKLPKLNSIKSSDHIICISNNTKEDLIKHYNIKEEKVSVIYLSSGILHSNEFNNTKYISKPYILFVGNRHNYKNWKILIDAYSSSDFLKNNYYLVCFGGGNVNNEEKKLLKSKDLTKNVKFVGGSDLKLSSYYLNCELFVYPSLYEGFGMPLLEALNHKKKIVCSEIPVFKEICEDVATYFDPFSKEDIREKLEFSLKSGGKLDVKSIEKVLKRFSWKKCSEHTIEVYNKCI